MVQDSVPRQLLHFREILREYPQGIVRVVLREQLHVKSHDQSHDQSHDHPTLMTHLEYSRMRSVYSDPRLWRYSMVGHTPDRDSEGPLLNCERRVRAGGRRGREGGGEIFKA